MKHLKFMKHLKGIWVKATAIVCSIILLVGLLAACTPELVNNTESSIETEKTVETTIEKQEPLEISIFSVYYGGEAPAQNSKVIKTIEEMTNTKLNVTWVPNSAYNEKLNVVMGSGSVPEVLINRGFAEPNTINAVRAGAFWEVGPYLKDYKNLSRLDSQIIKNVSVDGKLYGIYRTAFISSAGIVYRKDWLDNVGLGAPKNLDELYNVMKAFTYNDPDRNQKDDTVGLVDKGVMWSTMRLLAVFFGAPFEWGIDNDGKVIPDFLTDEYFEAMKFLKKAYAEKLIAQDFPVLSSSQSTGYINNGTAGMRFSSNIDEVYFAFNELLKVNPQAKMDFVTRISGPKGERLVGSSGAESMFMFWKNSLKSEDKLKKILEFCDRLLDKDFHDLRKWGIEGTHYTVNNGVAIQTPEQLEIFAKDDDTIFNLCLAADAPLALKGGNEDPLVTRVREAKLKDKSVAVYNATMGLLSQTYAEKGKPMSKEIENIRTKYIIGEIDEAEWKKALDTWRKNGGDKMIEEYTNEYKRANK